MKAILSLVFSTALMWSGCAVAVQEVKGVKLPESHQVAGQTLYLNGAGVRVKLFFDVYVAGLYLPRKEQTAVDALAASAPKTVQIVMLRDVSGDDLADATEKGFKANNAADELARYQPKLSEVLALMRSLGQVKQGTSITIDFLTSGVRISINGQRKGDIAAPEAFGNALLKNWLGAKPVDVDLKKALLGG